MEEAEAGKGESCMSAAVPVSVSHAVAILDFLLDVRVLFLATNHSIDGEFC